MPCPDPRTDGSHGVFSLSGRAAPVVRRLTLAKPVSGADGSRSSGPGGVRIEAPSAPVPVEAPVDRPIPAAPAGHAARAAWAGRTPADPAWSDREAGMATAEYAIATLAAVAFAGLLAVVLGSDEVRSMLVSLIRSALTLGKGGQ
ncbi:DUF4244 domain-containing protein [Arthrobacter yangruifuii]|uniref:DUF4244 domain-containing protein n=1 Tax=Arthrobacter yangruifuii TaxID=2606616 RepID=A0A5N6MUM5_9MICC|nr:DUF4244 domain-containing protein [Arthrobacter yangruifuii]